MRKIFFLLSLLGLFLSAQGLQGQEQETDSLTYYQKKISEGYNKKDYRQVLSSAQKAFAAFEKKSDEFRSWNPQLEASFYYHQACAYAQLGNTDVAVKMFTRAVDEGFADYYHASTDSDLKVLSGEPGFEKSLGKLRERGDYGYMLKQAAPYRMEPSDTLPAFTYQAATHPDLQRVRAYFNLDSIAGNGDEISRIKNLMYWMHDVVRHDGGSLNPDSKNAIDLVEICKKEGRGINCRQMAAALNECYLAIGIPSRFITCLPKSETDQDCHVINSVFSKTLNKWIWIDPTFAAFVTDENGNLLGIAEVRERLIKGEPLVLNEDANWNHKNKQIKEYYLDTYMAKNLYWLECPLRSEFDTETRRDGKEYSPYVRLYPAGFQFKDFGKQYIVTSNPDYFWQTPR